VNRRAIQQSIAQAQADERRLQVEYAHLVEVAEQAGKDAAQAQEKLNDAFIEKLCASVAEAKEGLQQLLVDPTTGMHERMNASPEGAAQPSTANQSKLKTIKSLFADAPSGVSSGSMATNKAIDTVVERASAALQDLAPDTGKMTWTEAVRSARKLVVNEQPEAVDHREAAGHHREALNLHPRFPQPGKVDVPVV
jgi:hypothetical protein